MLSGEEGEPLVREPLRPRLQRRSRSCARYAALLRLFRRDKAELDNLVRSIG